MNHPLSRRLPVSARAAVLAAALLGSPARAADSWQAVLDPNNSLAFLFVRDGKPVFRVAAGGWGPKWAWVGLGANGRATDDRLSVSVPFTVNQGKGEVIRMKFEASRPAARKIAFRYDLSAARDVPLTMLMAGFNFEPQGSDGTLTMTHADGKTSTLPLPIRGITGRPATSKMVLGFKRGGDVTVTLDPPCALGFDNSIRVMLAADQFKQGKKSVTLTMTFPGDVAFAATQKDLDRLTKTLPGPDWFAFKPSAQPVPSVISMDRWLEKPAGKRGGVRMAGDRFQFEDGTPVKFWGVNLSYTGCAPPRDVAGALAARFAKYGINAVRLHKFTYPTGQGGIGDPNDSTRMDPKGLDQLDHFSAELKRRGVYFGWSHTYGFRVVPGDRKRLLAYDEIEKNLKGNTYAFINFAEDVQDLMIDMVVNLLRHKNPHTGLTYAEEPALCYLELQNEDDIFFYSSQSAFNACPTYKKRFMGRFAKWLEERYGSEEKLKEAWAGALKKGESLAGASIEPQTNPWFFGSDNLPRQKGGARQRLLDTAAFLHAAQEKFYGRFVKAIRAAGYKGPLCGSPWQAPDMLPHYYNLLSDYRVGFIDRHNYFDGNGPDMFRSMLTEPGSGYFGSGMQQVKGRPFGLSEWIHVYPNVYGAEGPAIVAAYGLGLQGWDASFEFQAQAAKQVFDAQAGTFPWGVWEADVPTSLGQYPALARMIYRGDVKEGAVISVRRVAVPELPAGKFAFSDRIVQKGDVKDFGGTVSPRALAAGRVVVEFTDKPRPSTFPDLKRHTRGTTIHATTGQLAWDHGGKGWFTVNTPGTKAVVGFAPGKEFALGDVTITPDCPFASIFLTALDRDATLAKGKRVLLTVVARQSNTGFRYFTPDNRVIDNGKGPILLEPVKATIIFKGRAVEAVNVLDHDGRRTERTVAITDGRFTVDGAKERTMYYEVILK